MSSSSPGPETSAGRLLIDEPAPGVTRLTISNPARRGALDATILAELSSALGQLDAACVILTGEGTTFSAGYDIGNVPDSLSGEDADVLIAHPFAAALDALAAHPCPTLAALNGHTIGGGLELALACDLRIAAGGIKLAMPPSKLGVVYSDTGIRRFIDAIGAPRTRELFLVGRAIDAPTALSWGLINAIAQGEELAQEALALAVEIGSGAPLAQTGNKRVINAVLGAGPEITGELEHELAELRRSSFASEDFREGVRAFAQKRAPQWRGR